MAFRMIRYAIAAMHRHIEAGYEQLSLVIPILFYQGKTSPYPFRRNGGCAPRCRTHAEKRYVARARRPDDGSHG